MQVHYDAFISYRHSPKDSAIAQRLHRQLERFHVPKAIQKATGKKRIQRIFRDKEELPLSVNLSDDIDEALKNSDYLIVICSPRTMESQWVLREIQLFLETHTIDKVLIVLAEGEPDDVVPPVLMEGREPLCCDFRMPPRKAKQIELPRLAAALLGCRYDDLRQRQRQYRTRRMVAFFSAALAASLLLAVYFFQTARQIQENYEQALINQSRYLSSTSLDLLEEGDRLTAIALALEALPSADSPRPWVADAEYALGCATNAYTSAPNVLPVTAFTHSDKVNGMLLSEDGKYLVSWDDTDQLYIWDTQTYKLQHTLKPGVSLGGGLGKDPILLPDGSVILWDMQNILCGSCTEQGVRWQMQPGDYGYTFSNLIPIPDTKQLLVDCGSNLLLVSAADGKVEKAFSLPEGISSVSDFICASPDGSAIVFTVYDYFTGHQPYLFTLADGNFQTVPLTFYWIDCGYFAEDGKLFIAGALERGDSSYAFMDMVALYPSKEDIVCINSADASVLWNTQATYYQVNYGGRMGAVGCPTADGTVADGVYCCFGNVCVVLDAATGQLLSRGEAASSILDVVAYETRMRFLLEDGSLGLFYPDEQYIGSIRYFTDDLTTGRIVNDYSYFILPWEETRIFYYGIVGDGNYTFVTGSEGFPYPSVFAADSKLAVFSDDNYGSDNPLLSGCDLESQSILWQTPLETSSYNIHVAGMTSQRQLLLLQNSTGYGEKAVAAKMLRIDAENGQLVAMKLPLPADDTYDSYRVTNDLCALWGDRFAYLVNGSTMTVDHTTGEVTTESADTLMLMNPKNGVVKEYPLPVQGVKYLLPDTLGEKLLLGVPTEDAGMLCLILDRESGEVTVIETPIALDESCSHAQAAWAPDGSVLALPAEEDILLLNPDGTQAGMIRCDGRQLFSLCFSPASELLVLYADAKLCRYDLSGKVLSWTDLYYYVADMDIYSTVDWYFGQQGCGINISGLCTILDPESWQSYAYVPSCLLYAPELDRFFVQLETANTPDIACYQRYTTEELIAMAKEILGDIELTEDQRRQYGLN